MRRRISPEKLKPILQLNSDGLSNRRIALLTNISTSTVESYLREHGLKSPYVNNLKLNLQKLEKLREMWNSGVPVKEIERQLSISESGVSVWKRKLGLQPRSRGRRVLFDYSELPPVFNKDVLKAVILKRKGLPWKEIARLIHYKRSPASLSGAVSKAYHSLEHNSIQGGTISSPSCMLPEVAYKGVTPRVRRLLKKYGKCLSP